MAVLEHHPATLPRHHVDAEVVHLRRVVAALRGFARMVSTHKDVPSETRREAMRVLNESF
jgi:hypothetical protein